MLFGDKVILKPLTEGDVERIEQIVNNIFVKRYLRNVLPESSESWKEKIKRMYMCKYPTEMHFGIIVEEQIIGVVSLEDINWISRNGYITLAIYDEGYQGKGYGRETMELLLDYAFNYLNLCKINLEVYEYNKRAISFYEKQGFKVQGKLTKNNERFGRRYDVVVMGMTKEEYFKEKEEKE